MRSDSEPASVVAARQLAAEAHARRLVSARPGRSRPAARAGTGSGDDVADREVPVTGGAREGRRDR
ncbi:hypothetical protein [Modestobacter italicus]|uniref:hypothetical protein n=1 Tax=Modestobacter italicus (strain DSM 44449 / CECT 9708 / BC 501) TaxID=2732864 RepID=UPI001C95E4D1|nr:hypothetical protein [Modestobacter italicus]